MPNFYNGNELVYPTSINLIDDSDAPDASHFNPGVENLADRTAFINRRYVNGYDGGTYNPSHPIIIGDNGLEMPAAAAWWFYGLLHFDGTITGGGAPTPTVNFDGTNALLWLTSGAKMQVTASSVTFSAGAAWVMQTGTTASLAGGAELDVATGATIFVSGDITVGSGGEIVVQAGGEVTLARGFDLRIQDGTNPLYTTPRSITVAQPLVMGLGTTFLSGSSDFDKIVDNGAGGIGNLVLTALVHGSTMTSIVMHLAWASSHTPGVLASATLRKTNMFTGVTTTIAFTAAGTINTSGASSTNRSFNLATPEVIDRTLYQYTLQLSGEDGLSAQALTWRAPIVSMTVPQLGEW
jgi:hypothetical protein